MNNIQIGNREIGSNASCFIIAEAGVNHNGDINLAQQLIDAAVQAGADAVKFQTFKTEKLVNATAPQADYQRVATGTQESQFEMLQKLELSPADHRVLQAYCRERGILFMSTPFDEDSADFLAALDLPVFKISSGEITNLPLLTHIAEFQQPIILSTGMSTLAEVDQAVRTIRQTGNAALSLLHCVSNYPAAPADVNLRAMHTLSAAFQVPVGYSDHTVGIEVALAAVALGANIIEKHFTLDRDLPGPDHQASLLPEELCALVHGIRTVEAVLGHGRKEPAPSETNTAAVARKSLVAAQDILPGTPLTMELIAIKRPGTGLPPSMRKHLLGRTVREFVPQGELIRMEMLA